MKLLVITNDFPPRVGGINDYVAAIVRRFEPGEVVVFAADWPGARAFDESFPHRVVRWTSTTMRAGRAVADRAIELVRAERPDLVVFGATFPLGRIGARITAETGVPYGGFTHGVEAVVSRAPLARLAFARVARRAVLLTAVSEWARTIMRPVVGPRVPFHLLPPGIDPLAFHPDARADHLRARHGLGDEPTIVSVARLVPRKGNDMVIRALPHLAERFPDVRFMIVGGGRDEGRLRALARRSRVADRVVFTGQVSADDLPGYFRLGNVFAMPCRHRWLGFEVEAFGMVFIQASAVGRPVVGGAVGGAPEAVRHGETGFVVDPRSPRAIGDAIATLLADPARADALGAAGAAWVHRELTWDAIASRFRAMVEEALA